MSRFFFSRLTFFFIHFCFVLSAEHYVTYDLMEGSRFGDHLGDYLHGKWISYRTGYSFLFRPFEYSEELVLDDLETKWEGVLPPLPFYWCYSNSQLELEYPSPSLLCAAHFTTFTADADFWPHLKDYYLIDWEDISFLELARSLIQPKTSREELLKIPCGYESIGVHYRDFGLYDSVEQTRKFPTRFVPQSFYLDAFSTLIESLTKPLYVVIFTNHKDPQGTLKIFKKYARDHFPDKEIIVTLSPGSIGDGQGVLEDFFLMERVDYLIGAESSYSHFAGRLGRAKFSIRPQFFGTDNQWKPYILPVAIDMKYKEKDLPILFFDASARTFKESFFEWLRACWTAFKLGYRLETKFSEKDFERLKVSFHESFRKKKSENGGPLLPLEDIDWTDLLFKYFAREYWSPKAGYSFSLNQGVPSIVIALRQSDNLKAAYKAYRSYIFDQGWNEHQITLVFVDDFSIRDKRLAKETFCKMSKSFKMFDFESDPLEAMMKIGFHDVVIASPDSIPYYAALIFSKNAPISLKN